MTRPGRRGISRGALLSVAVATAVSLAGVWVTFAPLRDWAAYPLLYTNAHDALFNLFVVKTIAETGWYGHDPALGAPFGATFLDFPKPETLFLLCYRAAGAITRNTSLVHNAFYFAGFPLVTWSALGVLRRELCLSWPSSVAGGLLFSWLPFHFARIEHLFLSNYLVVPLAVALVLRVCGERPPFFEKGRLRVPAPGVWLMIALTGSASLYYAHFALLLICGAGLMAAIAGRAWRPAASAALVALALAGVVAANLAPSIAYQARHGATTTVAVRSLAESDLYALRPLQLVLPSVDHRLPALAGPARAYDASLAAPRSEQTAALGVFGAVGCILLLLHLLTGGRVLAATPAMAALSRAHALALLVGVAGGVGALVSLSVSPAFRALDRISVFIGFMAIAAFVSVLDRGLARLGPPRAWRVVAVSAVVVIVGYLDQTPAHARPDPREVSRAFESDRAFVAVIQEALPPGAMVYQLPYAGFPEQPPLGDEPYYSSLRPYLHSTSLRWSHGGSSGRYGDLWHRLVDRIALPQRVDVIQQAGFRGIVVDRRALRDRARDCERVLSEVGLPGPKGSADGSLAFYELPPDRAPDARGARLPVPGPGFYEAEGEYPDWWHWSRGDAELAVYDAGSRPLELSFVLSSLARRDVTVRWRAGALNLPVRPGVRIPRAAVAACSVGLERRPHRDRPAAREVG